MLGMEDDEPIEPRPAFDLDALKGTSKPIDPADMSIARQVSRDAGFHPLRPPSAPPASASSGQSGVGEGGARNRSRRKLSEVLPDLVTPRAQEERVQLNMNVPVGVARSFKALEQRTGLKQWQLLEHAVELIESAIRSGRITTPRA
jgi:hypothetical protein